MSSDTADGIDEPDPALPETQEQTRAARNDKQSTRDSPSEHLELVAVESFLQTDNEQDYSQGKQAEHCQSVVLIAQHV